MNKNVYKIIVLVGICSLQVSLQAATTLSLKPIDISLKPIDPALEPVDIAKTGGVDTVIVDPAKINDAIAATGISGTTSATKPIDPATVQPLIEPAVTDTTAVDKGIALDVTTSSSPATSTTSALTMRDQIGLQLQKLQLQVQLAVKQVARYVGLDILTDQSVTVTDLRNQIASISSTLGQMKDVVTYIQSTQQARTSYYQSILNMMNKGSIDIGYLQQIFGSGGSIDRDTQGINTATMTMQSLLKGTTPSNLAKYQGTVKELQTLLKATNAKISVSLIKNYQTASLDLMDGSYLNPDNSITYFNLDGTPAYVNYPDRTQVEFNKDGSLNVFNADGTGSLISADGSKITPLALAEQSSGWM